MQKQITPVMIIGSMKSGTTTLYGYLLQHPEICGGKEKEPSFFALRMGNPKYKQGNYYDIFDIDHSNHRFILDASTAYTKYPNEKDIPTKIKEYGLNPFFIYIIRNPFERIRSHYDFMQKKINWPHQVDSPYLINISKYFMQLQEYEKIFPKDRILLVDFDQLKHTPANLCNEIFQFIGAKKIKFDTKKNIIKNKTVPVNKKLLPLRNKLKNSKLFSPVFIKNYLLPLFDFFFLGQQKQLSEKEKQKIKELLSEDMENLRNNYDFDVSKWGF